MSPQGWGFLDKMDQLSLEDMLAILRPYLTNMVRKRQERVGPNPTQSLPLTLQHPATYLPPSLGGNCWILVLSRNPLGHDTTWFSKEDHHHIIFITDYP